MNRYLDPYRLPTTDPTNDAMTDESTPAIPIESHPDPVVAYALEDDAAVVTTVNDAFEATFGDLDPETVSDVLDGLPVESRSELPDALFDGDPIGTSIDGDAGETYRLRNVPVGGESGFLVVSELEATPGRQAFGLDHVAGIVSHDLRNPLDVAKAHLQAAAETGNDEHFRAVSEAHDRMEAIVRDVLTLARGRDAIDPSPQVSIEDVVESAWETVETDQATIVLDDTLPTVAADPGRIRRVFENLFRNSVEHGSTGNRTQSGDSVEHSSTTPPGRRDTAVEIRVGPLGNGFYVSDDGPGIPEDEREAVFEAGYTTLDRGTGLGLAIVERIVEAHGWEITLTDVENGGARFEVRFDRQTDG
jgi:signal transduction histidine kinase